MEADCLPVVIHIGGHRIERNIERNCGVCMSCRRRRAWGNCLSFASFDCSGMPCSALGGMSPSSFEMIANSR
eukprot:3054056-Amphidinium_carterae.2